ncbi:MAG: lysylphosphatidylglycerol synthase transmembrane domain-containing protein [Gammaproteobacteria bacterium]
MKLALRIAFSLALLGVVLWKIPVDAFLSHLSGVDLVPMLASYLLIPVMGYIDANRTKMMTDLQDMTLSVAAICRINFITSFYSLFLPGYLAGGVIRWHRIARHDGKPAQALAIVLFGRVIGTLVSVAIGLACWALDERARTVPIYGLALAALFLALLFAYWLLFSSGARAKSLADFLLRQRWVPAVVASKLGKVLHSGGRFDQLGVRRLGATVGLLVVHELIGITSFYLLTVALDMHLSFIAVGWVRCYIMLITMLPLTMMGIGVRDGSLIFLLKTYSISPALAVSYSTLLLGRTFVLGMLGGLSELWTVWRERARPTTGDTPA